MSEKNKNKGLSPEDADLWKRVTRTLDNSKLAKIKKAAPISDPSTIENSESDENNSLTDQNWHEHIDPVPAQKQRGKLTPASAPVLSSGKASPAKSNQKPKTNLTPKTEDFATLLDSYNNPVAQTEKNDQSSEPSEHERNVTPSKPRSAPKPAVETFNQRDARNISSGKQTIDGAIDLHGLTQREAETALKAFLKRAQQDDKRTVLVITGKGRKKDYEEQPFEIGAPEPGVLRRSVPLWLDSMPDIILSYTTSHIKHGGTGALYVRLRRIIK